MNINDLRLSIVSISCLLVAACGSASNGTQAAESQESTPVDLSVLDKNRARDGALGDMVKGNEEAEVTLVEYASFTCGHCANFHKTVYPDIKEKYIDTGKVKFIFREMPTAPHQLSYIGSVIARCAADKGGDKAYFAVADNLFNTQNVWAFGENPKLELLKIAGQVGMDEAALDTCLQRQEIVDVINENVEEARDKYKITGTPGFVLNGETLKLRTLNELDNALAQATGTQTDEDETSEAPTE